MKCEHEGCGCPARPVRLTVGMGHDSFDAYGLFCDAHLSIWLHKHAAVVVGPAEPMDYGDDDEVTK